MNPDKIRFNCPSCGIQLDVPASLAGVTGPCPNCQNSITAPHPSLPELVQPQPLSPPQPQPVATPQPQPVATPQPQPVATPQPQPVATPQPQPVATPQPQPVATPQPQTTVLPEQSYHYPSGTIPEPIPVTEDYAEHQHHYSPPQAQTYPPEPVQAQALPPEPTPQFPPEADFIEYPESHLIESSPQEIHYQETNYTSPPSQVHATPAEPPFPIEPEPILPTSIEPPLEPSEGYNYAVEPQGESRHNEALPSKPNSRIPSILFLLFFLLSAAVLVIGLLNITGIVGLNSLKDLLRSSEKPSTSQTVPPTQISSIEPITERKESIIEEIPEPSNEVPPIEETLSPATSSNPSSITPKIPEGEDYREGQTPLPAGLGSESGNPEEVQEILANFFRAKTLAERENFLSPRSLNDPNIADSILARPIPEPTVILFRNHLRDTEEQRSDFFYVASWEGQSDAPADFITVELHKWPGNEPYRVNSEAFLEFTEKKLRRYASVPLDRPARFFALATLSPVCFEKEAVPDHLSKATLTLGTSPRDENSIKVYLNKNSEMYEELSKHRNGLIFRKEIPLTLTLAWSKPIENKRYLEVHIIDSFDWHP